MSVLGPEGMQGYHYEYSTHITMVTSAPTETYIHWHNTTGQTVIFDLWEYTSVAAYTGAATNFRSWEAVNWGTAGGGTDEMASFDGDNGNDLVKGTPQVFTNNTTAANLEVDADETVVITYTENGTGLGLTGGGIVMGRWHYKP